jgi:hypothetical protein
LPATGESEIAGGDEARPAGRYIVVFTFHIDMSDPSSGDPLGRWMVTKVLERTDDGWAVIHTHFGLPAPPPEEAPGE